MNNAINTEVKPTIMIRIFNKVLQDTREFDSWEEVIASGFCHTGAALVFQAAIRDEGKAENEFWIIREVRFEVLHAMVLGEPENIWQEGTEPQTFASKAEAQAEIDEHIKDVEEAVARGDMTDSDETDPETYIISEVKV